MKEVSLYIHIPFCIKKCLYCDFLSFPASEKVQESYFNALLHEIDSYKDKLSGYSVKSIFFGGGTPSLPNALWIKRTMDTLRSSYNLTDDCEITMEMNPATEAAEKMNIYRKAGINRLSIGLQSTNDTELKKLGRMHDYDTFLKCYEDARQAGFENINIDIMSALPGQSIDSYEKTVRRVVQLSPEHISAYSLIVEEGTPFYDMYGDEAETEYRTGENGDSSYLPTEDEDRQMYELTLKILEESGYHRYEISNYAKKDLECRHNITYWTRGNYVGFGIGAASLLENVRWNNTRVLASYTAYWNDNIGTYEDIICDREELDQKAQMEEYMFLGLRLVEGVSISKFEEYFGIKLIDVYNDIVKNFTNEGLLVINGDKLGLTKKGLNVSNYVMSEFLL